MRERSGRARGLLLGSLLDLVFADPRRGHPVAGFGRTAEIVERWFWADSRGRGLAYTAACVGAAAGIGALGERLRGAPYVAAVAAGGWMVLGGTTLAREGQTLAAMLAAGDLPAARVRLGHLCGRDARHLDAGEIARAGVESLAENTSDAVVAPLLWGAVAGLPGLLAYRAVNTLDAMVGHRNRRYARFGWAAARLDDLVNMVPARVTALLAAALAPAVGGSPAAALRTLRRDGGKHPSPNAGRCEAAFAGALGIRLGGVNSYGGRPERRGPLGDGRPPGVADLERAARLSRLVGLAAALLAGLTSLTCGMCRRRSGRIGGSR
jgi:adenosylcobinamide-phosphate synthase